MEGEYTPTIIQLIRSTDLAIIQLKDSHLYSSIPTLSTVYSVLSKEINCLSCISRVVVYKCMYRLEAHALQLVVLNNLCSPITGTHSISAHH